MKILKPPTNDQYKTVHTLVCSRCGAMIEFDEQDMTTTDDGYRVKCPCCNLIIAVHSGGYNQPQDEEEPEPPHFVWPDSFYHFGESTQAVKIPDKEVQQMIDRIVKRFPELRVGDFDIEATGDTTVLGLKYEDSNTVIVAKNYWEDEIETEE